MISKTIGILTPSAELVVTIGFLLAAVSATLVYGLLGSGDGFGVGEGEGSGACGWGLETHFDVLDVVV